MRAEHGLTKSPFVRSRVGQTPQSSVDLAYDRCRSGCRTATLCARWLDGILKNAGIDELRARGRHGGDASGTLSIEQALEHLPKKQRLAVALVLIEGLPYKEAAQIIGVPVGILTGRLARGREALQELLEPGGAE